FSFSVHPAPSQFSPLSLHDALPISDLVALAAQHGAVMTALVRAYTRGVGFVDGVPAEPIRAVIVAASARLVANPEQVDAYVSGRSEEHTSELQSRENLVCRLLLEKK